MPPRDGLTLCLGARVTPVPSSMTAAAPVDLDHVEYSLDDDRVNSETSQRVSIRALKSPEIGVRQDRLYLPLHREADYEVSVWLRTDGVDAVALSVADGSRILTRASFTGLGQKWARHTARLRMRETVAIGAPLTLTLSASQPGDLWIDQLFVFPADHVGGFDRDVVDLCRRARLSMLRFPGGNFVSGYHWRDGIGPVDERPMRRNPAWHCPEYNHVGTDELLQFCEVVGSEPLICINAGSGTPEEAARWVEYVNGSIESRLGALRAKNGHPAPYRVRYWEIGNELYGRWQVGHCSADEYARRYAEYVEAMRRVDPDILFIANGRDASWHAPVLAKHAKRVRSFALHPLIGGGIPRTTDRTETYLSLMAYPTWYRGHLERLGGQMEQAGTKPRLAITELQIFTNKPGMPTNGTHSEAIYMARYFHTAIRLGRLVELLTHSALVNHGGGLRKQSGVVYPQPSWLATHLYGTMEGTIPVAIDVRTPAYSSAVRSMPHVENAPYLDAIALTDTTRSVLTVMLVNVHPKDVLRTTFDMGGWPIPRKIAGRRISGSFMDRNSTTDQERVKVEPIELAPTVEKGAFVLELPPCSITEIVLPKTR